MTIHKDNLLNRLNELLESGRFPNQSRLPPERDLAAELGTTRARLRQTLAVLEAEGKIWRHVGQGTFAGHRLPASEPALSLLMKATHPNEIMETRLIIEPRVAELAALRATPGDVTHLQRCLKNGTAALDFKTYELWDSALHEAVAEASHSAVLSALLKLLTALREDKLWGRIKEASLTRERQKVYNSQHARCVEAITDRDRDRAGMAMREHLSAIHMDMFGRPSDIRD